MSSNVQAEATTIFEAVKYWGRETQVQKILETDSIIMVNMLRGTWEVPWEIAELVEEIQAQIQHQSIQVQHIFREGNRIADFLANQAAEEQTELIYKSFHQLPN